MQPSPQSSPQTPADLTSKQPATAKDPRTESRRPLVTRFRKHLESDPEIYDIGDLASVFLPWILGLSADNNASLERAFHLAETLGEYDLAIAWVTETTAMNVVNFLLPALEQRYQASLNERKPAN